MRFGKLTGYEAEKGKITLDFEGTRAGLQVITAQIVRVFYEEDGVKIPSKAIEGEKAVETPIRLERKEDGLWVSTDALSARVSDGFHVDFFDPEGAAVCLDYRGERKPIKRLSDEYLRLLEGEGHSPLEGRRECVFEVVKKLEGSEHFYGLGDKTGFLDMRHYDYEMWNTDNPVPFS